MKTIKKMKQLVIVAIAILGFSSVNAQTVSLGVSGGGVTGGFSNSYGVTINADANIVWDLSEQIQLGAAVGYLYSFGKKVPMSTPTVRYDDASFVPLAMAIRFKIANKFIVGSDIGYALGVNPTGNDGGFYYAPRMQFEVSEKLSIVGTQRTVNVSGGNFNTLALGVEVKL